MMLLRHKGMLDRQWASCWTAELRSPGLDAATAAAVQLIFRLAHPVTTKGRSVGRILPEGILPPAMVDQSCATMSRDRPFFSASAMPACHFQ